MKRKLVAPAALALLLTQGAAHADTLSTGVLSPDTVYLMCKRAGAHFFDFGADGYGCKNSKLMISCRPDLQCVSKVRDLNSYIGNPLDAYMRQHGQQQVDPLSQDYSE